MGRNNHLLNKVKSIEIIGKGSKDNFFGKIDDIICFITEPQNPIINIGDVVDIKITGVAQKCLFCELIQDET